MNDGQQNGDIWSNILTALVKSLGYKTILISQTNIVYIEKKHWETNRKKSWKLCIFIITWTKKISEVTLKLFDQQILKIYSVFSFWAGLNLS